MRVSCWSLHRHCYCLSFVVEAGDEDDNTIDFNLGISVSSSSCFAVTSFRVSLSCVKTTTTSLKIRQRKLQSSTNGSKITTGYKLFRNKISIRGEPLNWQRPARTRVVRCTYGTPSILQTSRQQLTPVFRRHNKYIHHELSYCVLILQLVR